MIDIIPLLITCPSCGERHIDNGIWATKPHHTHACQSCGMCWRPTIVNTVGVQFLPGFKNDSFIEPEIIKVPEAGQTLSIDEEAKIISYSVLNELPAGCRDKTLDVDNIRTLAMVVLGLTRGK